MNRKTKQSCVCKIIESVIKNLCTKKNLGPNGLYQPVLSNTDHYSRNTNLVYTVQQSNSPYYQKKEKTQIYLNEKKKR